MDVQEIDQKLEHYLLGELSTNEQDELEEKYFDDDKLFGQLTAAENNLIDDYLGDRMDTAKRQRFERYYMNTEQRRRRVFLAQALRDKELELPSEETIFETAATERESAAADPWWQRMMDAIVPRSHGVRYGLACTMTVALIITVGLSLYLNRRLKSSENQLATVQRRNSEEVAALRGESQQLRTQLGQEKEGRESLEAQLSTEQTNNGGRQPRTPIPSYNLGTAAGGSVPTTTNPVGKGVRISLPSDARLSRFTLTFKPDKRYDTYAVKLRSSDGQELPGWANLKARYSGEMTFMTLLVPTKWLSDGEYVFEVNGLSLGASPEPAALFRIEVKKN